MSFILGLTGSIGMGKSTTARLFSNEGCAVWDADSAVHGLYVRGGAAVPLIGELFPETVMDGMISRQALKERISSAPAALGQIEAIVHPLVAADRRKFIAESPADILVLDIPLLFEKGSEKDCDATVCVTAPAEVQRARVLERGTMSEAQFELILSKQMADAEKRRRATYVVETDTMEHARAQVQAIVADIRKRLNHA